MLKKNGTNALKKNGRAITTICRLYVAQCGTKDHFYVGTTLRIPYMRDREHRERTFGAAWTRQHGYRGMLTCDLVDPGHASTLEDDMTKYLMSIYGKHAVRGGNFLHENWLPWEFTRGSPADVLKLRTGTVSKFGSELRGLIDRFSAVCGLENPDHLYADPLP